LQDSDTECTAACCVASHGEAPVPYDNISIAGHLISPAFGPAFDALRVDMTDPIASRVFTWPADSITLRDAIRTVGPLLAHTFHRFINMHVHPVTGTFRVDGTRIRDFRA
jgi:hypothetical protein